VSPGHPARKELVAGLVLCAIAGLYLLAGRRYPLDSLVNPGPGVFPLAIGLLLLALAGMQVVRAVLRRPRATETARSGSGPPDAAMGLPAVMLAALVVYLLAMPWLGFQLSTLLLVLVAAKLMGTPGWARPAVLAAGVLLGCWLVFSLWLRVPLPRGALGIG
jgi:putative tricarboxylic transport membrane protein